MWELCSQNQESNIKPPFSIRATNRKNLTICTMKILSISIQKCWRSCVHKKWIMMVPTNGEDDTNVCRPQQHITHYQILDSSKLKYFADDNFKFDENGRKFSKWVENTVGKGEIARYEQFLLFPRCFQTACFPWA